MVSRMSEDEVVEIARVTAKERGWTWRNPVEARRKKSWNSRRLKWHVRTNAGALGAIAVFTIDDDSGEILRVGYVPR